MLAWAFGSGGHIKQDSGAIPIYARSLYLIYIYLHSEFIYFQAIAYLVAAEKFKISKSKLWIWFQDGTNQFSSEF